ncbi:uncharacterized protein LOC112015134 isoform X1 [Quercus suber]|uniref:uncharacterized protein LOC112015134 isoform X1 n=1 Tax=Quercus suber TaxID=58331 RepID=UPI0032DFCE73
MENKKSAGEAISSAQAVFLGALAPGVNGPTWNTLRTAFVLLGVCLVVMLALAFSASDSSLILHVGFLVLLTVTLFLLLSCSGKEKKALKRPLVHILPAFVQATFLAQTGLVSVEHQMREMDLMPNDCQEISRKNK